MKKSFRIMPPVIVFIFLIAFSTNKPVEAQTENNRSFHVTIETDKQSEKISPYIYGQFIEHLGRCINGGGIWSEMLEDRKFFYPVGSKESPWKAWRVVESGSKSFQPEMDETEPFVGEHTPKLEVGTSSVEAALGQRELALEKGRKYVGSIWLKCTGKIEKLSLSAYPAVSDQGEVLRTGNFQPLEIPIKYDEYYKHSFEFEWNDEPVESVDPADYENAMLFVSVKGGAGTVHIGTLSLMPKDNVHGMRKDTLELMKRLDSPVYRWPGGNFVSGYDWKDGIGDRDRRPPRKNPAWKGVEPNDFGMDEFMVFCKILGTEPFIAVNTGNGEVESALEELEYANGDSSTPMGKWRAENGHVEPYDVVWWGIGNEMYGDWQIGHMPVDKYVLKHNRFVDAFRAKDPKIKAIAVGSVGGWDEAFLPGAAKHMDLISEHFYIFQGDDDVTKHAWKIPHEIKRIADAHRKYRKELPNFKDVTIPIAMDEWNYWYRPHVFGELGTRYVIRDGLGIAAGIHEFARQSDMYFMANYAQTVNVIGCIKTSKTKAKMETTGLVLELYRKHFGTVPVSSAIKADGKEKAPIDVQAAVSESKNELTVGIVNTLGNEVEVVLDISGFDTKEKALTRYEIVDPENNPDGHNDPDQPYRIEIKESKSEKPFGDVIQVKPYSVTLLKFS